MPTRACAVALLLAAVAAAQTHAGQPVPEFVHGDECLFCHRNDVGNQWQKNRHGATLRQREDAPALTGLLAGKTFAGEVEYFLGSRGHVRFLKKDGYGKFAIESGGAWERGKFESRCAGCHATGVDPATRTFAAFGIDCFACHGDVTLDHTKDTSLMWLSKKRRGDARAVTSICAQCHLRGGKSRSTGLPWANNFIAGDNLFLDFEADFAKPSDPHVFRSVRDVMEGGSEVTCISCHRVHAASGARHRLVLTGPICADCHNAAGPRKFVKPYQVQHSALCEY